MIVVRQPSAIAHALTMLNSTIERVEKIIALMPPNSQERVKWQNGLSNLNDFRRLMEDRVS